MKFVDLNKDYEFYRDEILSSFDEIGKKERFLFGSEVHKLEEYFSSITEKKHAVSVKNCTDATIMVLRRIYKEGMTIILPNFGAYPTAVSCKNITDNIYYVDVDESMTIDPNKLPKDIKNGIIIPVHLFGNNCDMDSIMKYAKENNHIVVEDCAQSSGSGSGVRGDYAVFSFYPTKPLGSMGDGGMICCNKDDDYDFFSKYKFYGQHNNNIEFIGINSRMDEIQSMILNIKTKHFNNFNEKRIEIANRYKKHIKGIKVNTNSVFHQFTVLFNDRELIQKKLDIGGIPYIIHYPKHVSEIPALKGIHNEVGFRVNDKILSLPVHPFLSEMDILRIENFLEQYKDYEY